MIVNNTEETMVVAVYNDVVLATAAKDKLESAGIRAFLVDENVVGLDPVSGIELKIFKQDLSKATALLETGPQNAE